VIANPSGFEQCGQGFDDVSDGVVGKTSIHSFDEVKGGEVADPVSNVDCGDTAPDDQ
jgi:hypothetical protein